MITCCNSNDEFKPIWMHYFREENLLYCEILLLNWLVLFLNYNLQFEFDREILGSGTQPHTYSAARDPALEAIGSESD